MDGKTLFGFGAALAIGLGLYFWYAGADKPPVPEFADFQRMNLSADDRARLLANIKAWFASKGLDLSSPADQSKIAAYLTAGQQQTIAALTGGSFGAGLMALQSVLKALVAGTAPASP